MLGRIGTFFSLLAVFVMIDGNWAVLQSVAWAKMIESELSAGTGADQSALPKRLAETFSGQRPCSLCVAISDQRAIEEEKDRGVDSRTGGIQICPVAFTPVTVFPLLPKRTAFLENHEIFTSLILPSVEPPPRSGGLVS